MQIAIFRNYTFLPLYVGSHLSVIMGILLYNRVYFSMTSYFVTRWQQFQLHKSIQALEI